MATKLLREWICLEQVDTDCCELRLCFSHIGVLSAHFNLTLIGALPVDTWCRSHTSCNSCKFALWKPFSGRPHLWKLSQ